MPNQPSEVTSLRSEPQRRRSIQQMKQIVTILSPHATCAKRVIGLCLRARKAELCRLLTKWRKEAKTKDTFCGYVEYLDAWSMGDTFRRILGPGAKRRATPNGELYVIHPTPTNLAHLHLQSERSHQFREYAELARQVSTASGADGDTALHSGLVIFREILGGKPKNKRDRTTR